MIAGLALALFFDGLGSSYANTHEKKADAAYQLVFRQDRLTVKTDRTPLVQLLKEIAAAAGIEIVTASRMYADQLVAADIQDGSVVKIIQALLAGYNYLIFLSADTERQGLHLLSGTMPAPAGEKLLVLTTNGDGYQLKKGGLSQPFKGKMDGMGATGVSAVSSKDKALQQLSRSACGNRAEPMRDNLFLPANEHEEKEEKSTMQTRETSYSRDRAAENKATSLAGTENSWTSDDEEKLAEYGDAAALRESFNDDFDTEDEETAANDSFVREDYLRYQIDKLTTRIESGYSDRQYEFWSQKRDAKYVSNDRDLLSQYEKELRTLEDKN